MTEQSVASPVQDATMPGELIYEYTVQFTGVTSYGAPDLGALLSGAVESPPQGARYDVAFEGPVVGQKLRGTVKGIDHLHIRPDGRGQLHIHAEIMTGDGKKIALSADGVAIFKDGPPIGDLREDVTLTTSEPDYAWVNPLRSGARGRRPCGGRGSHHRLRRLAPVKQRTSVAAASARPISSHPT